MDFKVLVQIMLLLLVVVFVAYSTKTYLEALELRGADVEVPEEPVQVESPSEEPTLAQAVAEQPSSPPPEQPAQQEETPVQEDSSQVTKSQAIEIALGEVDGNVTNALVARRYGEISYVIEIVDDDETFEVIVDID